MNDLLKIVAALAVVVSFSGGVNAQSNFEAGKDYEITASKTQSEPLLEEFFNYACGACYGSEQLVNSLKKKFPSLKFKAIPVGLRPAWEIYVKAYYLGEKLDVLDKSHSKIFHRIHVEKKHFKGEEDMKAFFLSLGVESKAYDDVANSYWINTQMRMAKQYTKKHGAFQTPTFLVNKRFKLNRTGLGSYERIEQAVEELSGLSKAENSK
jgi:protein dithiol oxidoreductase (disulfide-forming)